MKIRRIVSIMLAACCLCCFLPSPQAVVRSVKMYEEIIKMGLMSDSEKEHRGDLKSLISKYEMAQIPRPLRVMINSGMLSNAEEFKVN